MDLLEREGTAIGVAARFPVIAKALLRFLI
jgi:hypothetical protein